MADDAALVPPEQRDGPHGWIVITAPGKSSHVIPMGDLKDHECTGECWCRPEIDDEDDMIVHNAMDRREEIERGTAHKH